MFWNFGKKKDEKKDRACCSNDNENSYGKEQFLVTSIKVLGPGCRSCHNLNEAAKEALKELCINVQPEYITDIEKIMEYNVMSMPALLINEKVVSMGKALKASEIIKLIKKTGYRNKNSA